MPLQSPESRIMCRVSAVNANDYVLTPVAGERMEAGIDVATITVATTGTPPTAVGQRVEVRLGAR